MTTHETFIGGKARNMHIEKRKRRITGTGGKDKTVVMGILERGGNVRAAESLSKEPMLSARRILWSMNQAVFWVTPMAR